MISNLKAIALFAISTSPVYAALPDMEFASGGSLCAGVDKDTTIFIGKKGDTACTKDSFPTEYISLKAENFAFLKTDAKAYLSDITLVKEVPAATGSGDSGTLHTVGPFAEILKFDGNNTQVAYASAGIYMGEPAAAEAYGFVGTASYLGIKGTRVINSNDFRIPGTDQNGKKVVGVCIAELTVPTVGGAAACGPATTTIGPGDYKYSLYGYTQGDGYEAFVINTGGANTYTHFGVRNAITTKHLKGSLEVAGAVEVIVNHTGATAFSGNVSSIPAAGFTGVTKLEIKGGNTHLKIDFPQKYNIGAIDPAEGAPIPKKTKDIVINLAKNNDDGFYLDFVFEADEELSKKDGYFVYDPSVDAVASPNGDGASTGGAQGSSVAGVLSLMALSWVFLL